jgi:hypothetical protein
VKFEVGNAFFHRGGSEVATSHAQAVPSSLRDDQLGPGRQPVRVFDDLFVGGQKLAPLLRGAIVLSGNAGQGLTPLDDVELRRLDLLGLLIDRQIGQVRRIGLGTGPGCLALEAVAGAGVGSCDASGRGVPGLPAGVALWSARSGRPAGICGPVFAPGRG